MRRAAALLALFALALAALGGMSARLWPDAAAPAETLLVYGDAAALEGAVLSYSGELAGHVEWSAPAGESAAPRWTQDYPFGPSGAPRIFLYIFDPLTGGGPSAGLQYMGDAVDAAGRKLEGFNELWPLSGPVSGGMQGNGSTHHTSAGWAYTTAEYRDGSGRLLDGSGLPGGGFGLWRIRCYPRETPDTERWWAKNTPWTGVFPEPETLEPVLIPEGDWRGLWAKVSWDGREVLACVVNEDMSVRFAVIDAVSGAIRQDTELIDAGTAAEYGDGRFVCFYVCEGGVLVQCGSLLLAMERGADGKYAPALAVNTRAELAERFPEYAWADGYAPGGAFLREGRLVVLYVRAGDAVYNPRPLLLAFDSGGLAACAEITRPYEDIDRLEVDINELLALSEA